MMVASPFLFLITLIMTLCCMAFFTLLERKIIASIQLRRGPNKATFAGMTQPFADAIKLYSKSNGTPSSSNSILFGVTPLLGMTLSLLLWVLAPNPHPFIHLPLGLILFMCLSSVSVFVIIIAGWSSNSKFSLLGAMRGATQTISYEVSMSISMIALLIYVLSYDVNYISTNFYATPLFLSPPLAVSWVTCLIAETHRTPFDMAEGESELVSGFNTEYGGSDFALLFMSEYITILFMALLSAAMIWPSSLILTFPSLMFKATAMLCLFVLIRATLPRMRYDHLMSLAWLSLLPLSLGLMSFTYSLMTLIK